MKVAKLCQGLTLAVVLVCCSSIAPAQAPVAAEQAYPSRPIKVIVPFPPGGPTDLYARVIVQKLQEAWSQPVVVENRVGGTGQVGSGFMQQSPADGYTLLFTSNSVHVISPLLRNPRLLRE